MIILFVLLSILHLGVILLFPLERIGILFTKGLPIAFLIITLFKSVGIGSHLKKFIFIGLLFSICGDYILSFPEYFVFGLASFLIAHVFYIIAFSNGAKLAVEKSIPIYLIGGSLYFLLFPGLGDLKIPVLLYVITISTMVWRAFARNHSNKDSYYAGALGACIFFVSDSLIGLSKFYTPIPADRFLIMLTYYTGQFLIFRSAEKE